jgi:ABC-2 type transport system ATP-binding protein
MIEVKGLVKKFDGFPALNGASLTVEKGAVYGLVGPNGAGKSTLIRHLAGVYRQDEGQVLVAGSPVYENIELKARIAFIPDDIHYFMQASTRDMMRFYKGLYPQFDMERYEKLREVFKDIDEKRSIRRLSKGMQKQSAFWLAVCRRPEIILLDEPVDGLDPIMRKQVWSIILSDVAERGTTVLVSSHNLRELEDVCDHVGIMDRGKVVLQRSVSDLQGNVTKIQAVFENGLPELPPELEVMHLSQSGRVYTLIIRSSREEAKNRLASLSPLLLDAVPLTLEEIFIYELGGHDDAIKNILVQ